MKSTEELEFVAHAAARFDLAPHVLRHWEDVGLVTPRRDAGGRRRYGRSELTQIAFVVRAKEAGLSLPDILAIATASDGGSRHEILEQHRADLEARRAALVDAIALVDHLLGCRNQDFYTCSGFRSLLDSMVVLTGSTGSGAVGR